MMDGEKFKQIIVLGIYSSGTSMVAGILANLGIDMGDCGYGKDADKVNPKGYFEDRDFSCVNHSIYRHLRRDYIGILEADYKRIERGNDNRTEELKKELKDYIKKRNKKKVWGVKDPRMVPLFPLYQKHLENPYIIIIRRSGKDITSSLRRKSGRSQSAVNMVFNTHFKILNGIKTDLIKRKWKFIELEYNDFLSDPRGQVQKICDFIEVKINKKAVNFIMSSKEKVRQRKKYEKVLH